MSTRVRQKRLLAVPLVSEKGKPLYKQICETLRQQMLDGRLRPMEKLPSSRSLAEELSVSRMTVQQAYDQLLAEGYLQTAHGSGTFVSDALPDEPLRAPSVRSHKLTLPRRLHSRQPPKRHFAKLAITLFPSPRPIRPFRPCLPELRLFPMEEWQRCADRVMRSASRKLLSYADPHGYEPLRELIAKEIAPSRGIECDAEQVLMVSGTQHATFLAAFALCDPEERVMMEDPGYMAVRSVFTAQQLAVLPTPVDNEGLVLPKTHNSTAPPRLIFVAPSFQFPLGVTMSLGRRLQLLTFAEQSGAWIIEDDYDHEFRYSARPLPSLKSLDAAECVIYVGTFSKSLFPALRLAYLIVPRELLPHMTQTQAIMERHAPLLEQATVAGFITCGSYARHVRRMRVVYRKRQQALLEAVDKHLRGRLRLEPREGGMHLIGEAENEQTAALLVHAAHERGLELASVGRYAAQPREDRRLILGYTMFSERELQEGVRALARAAGAARRRR